MPSHRPFASFNLVIEVLLISRDIRYNRYICRIRSFNLVIEVLLISSQLRQWMHRVGPLTSKFQSRNRGSFDFKTEKRRLRICRRHRSFNLVIEVLLISSSKDDRRCGGLGTARFNLVIEVLLISRTLVVGLSSVDGFQHSFNLVIEVLLISRHERGLLR